MYFNNLGLALFYSNQIEEATDAYNKALGLEWDWVEPDTLNEDADFSFVEVPFYMFIFLCMEDENLSCRKVDYLVLGIGTFRSDFEFDIMLY